MGISLANHEIGMAKVFLLGLLHPASRFRVRAGGRGSSCH